MPIDFPNSPAVNDTFTNGFQTWKWNGSTWDLTTVQGPIGPTGPAGINIVNYTYSGTLSVTTGTSRWYSPTTLTISNVIVSVGTAPTGASVLVDVNKNGSTIFSTQANRPTITATNFADTSSIPDTVALAQGDYLTVDIDQVGSTVAGADLVVQIVL